MNTDKWEERVKQWDDRLPNLAKALRSEDLQKSCADIDQFDGWIRCISSLPKKGEPVLVTDGKSVWMGEICHTERRGAMPFKEWSLVYDGAPPFKSTEVIAWMFMPYVPKELLNSEQNPEGSVATEDEQGTEAGKQKPQPPIQ